MTAIAFIVACRGCGWHWTVNSYTEAVAATYQHREGDNCAVCETDIHPIEVAS